VLLEVLCDLVSPSVRISAHSPHNAQAMSAWASARGSEHRIQVFSDYPKAVAGKSGAVIVANAACDHEKAIEWALSERLPVLVEKPVTLSSAATQRMADLAMSKETYLAAAHVFLFARYVEAFSKLVAEGDGVQSIRVQWMDPQSESRYGETKSYDPGLTVYADWLPHIVSILGTLSPNLIQPGRRLEVSRGGAHVKMDIQLGDIPCEIEMVRNGASRQRLIEVVTREGLKSLDFAKEPGMIVSAASARCGDPAWDIEPRPAATMLRAFLQGAAGGARDERLDIGIGLHTSRIIDQLSPAYHTALSDWLGKKYSALGEDADADLHYVLSEILYVEDPLSSVPAERRVEYVYRHLKGTLMSQLRAEYENRPMELIRLILKQGKLASYL
jgi:predicted dehydrogenase